MGMALVPMVGPLIGGFLEEAYGWRSTFLLMLVFGVVTFAIVFFDLGETNRHPSASLGAQFRTYPELIGSHRFWGYVLTAAFTSGAFFAFVGGGPYVSSEILHLSPSQYGFYFGIISVGYMLGNFLSGRLSSRIGINRMMFTGNLVAVAGMVIAILLFGAGYDHPLSLFGPAFFTGVGNGITLPNANAGIVSVKPHLAGSASGLGGAMQIGGGAALSVVAAHLLAPRDWPYPLLWVMLLSSAAAVLSTLMVMRVLAPRRGVPVSAGPFPAVVLAGGRATPHGRRRQARCARSAGRPLLGACARPPVAAGRTAGDQRQRRSGALRRLRPAGRRRHAVRLCRAPGRRARRPWNGRPARPMPKLW